MYFKKLEGYVNDIWNSRYEYSSWTPAWLMMAFQLLLLFRRLVKALEEEGEA